MKTKKISILLAASTIMIAGISLSSCGNGGTVVENAGEQFELKTLDDLKKASSESKPIEVSFWHSFGDTIEKPLSELVEQFTNSMKEKGIYIDVKVASSGGGYEGLRSRVNQGVSSNSLPTMLLGYPDHFADYINSNILLPLDDFVYSTDTDIGLNGAYDYKDFVSSFWNENLLDVDSSKEGDEIAGIPFNKSTEVMYYNSNIIDPILSSHGWLDENNNWKNPTWEQVWTVSTELKTLVENKNCKWTHKGVTYESKKTQYPVYIDSESNFFITTARQWCKNQEEADKVYTTSTSVKEGVVRFDNPITREAQNYFLDKANKGLWNIPKQVSMSYGSKVIKNLEAFISIGSTAGVKNNTDARYELKVTKIPQRSYDENKAIQAAIQQGTNCTILSKNSNNLTRLAAWLLIRYMTSTESTTFFSKSTGYLPVRQSAIDTDEYQRFLGLANKKLEDITDPNEKVEYASYVNVSRAINAANSEKEYFYVDKAFKGSSVIRGKLDNLIQTIYVTGKSIDFAYESIYNSLRKQGITCEKVEK